jgi:hypothetical protein
MKQERKQRFAWKPGDLEKLDESPRVDSNLRVDQEIQDAIDALDKKEEPDSGETAEASEAGPQEDTG